MTSTPAILALALAAHLPAAAAPLARWRFDSNLAPLDKVERVQDDAANQTDPVRGNAWTTAGVRGSALQLDGITAHIVRPAAASPKVSGPFTIEAWVALAAYPFNWCPIVQQQDGEKAGYFFGIGDHGQAGFRLAAGGKWYAVETTGRLPLGEWTHLVAVFQGTTAGIYLNGKLAGSTAVVGELAAARSADLWIGRNRYDLEQTQPVSPNRQYEAPILFDGILDEIILSDGAASAEQIGAAYLKSKPSSPPRIEARRLPAGPAGAGRFGAAYTHLTYYKGWDDYWRVGDYPDVVVRFDQAPIRFVFWRGTSYIPHWVTENGIWYDNEFTESFQPVLRGSAEPMSDKICRFSNVRIIESSDARVVIHWRYAPVDVGYKLAFASLAADWGDWTDEVYTIYPDAVAVRDITVHTNGPPESREWQESIVVMGPGISPKDAIEPAALTLLNPQGESKTYSWENSVPPKKPTEPSGANLQIIHTKSKYQPFASARPQDKPWFDVYAGEIRRDVSVFPWWNHWPTAFEPSNGRYALAADRASHSSLTHLHWDEYEKTGVQLKKVMLHGLSDRPAAEVAAISRSWTSPPQASAGGVYDMKERAYVFNRPAGAWSEPLRFTINATKDSPVRNLALVLRNWGDRGAQLELDGKPVKRGPDFRVGRRAMVDASDLVVWIRVEADRPLEVSLAAATPDSSVP